MSSINQCNIIVPTVQTVMTHLLTLLIPPLRILLQAEKTVWDGKSSELMKQLQSSLVRMPPGTPVNATETQGQSHPMGLWLARRVWVQIQGLFCVEFVCFS